MTRDKYTWTEEKKILERKKENGNREELERKSFRFSRFRDNEIYRWLDSVDVRGSSSGTVSGTSNGVTVSIGGDDRVPSLFSCNFYDSLLPLPFSRLSVTPRSILIAFSLCTQGALRGKLRVRSKFLFRRRKRRCKIPLPLIFN